MLIKREDYLDEFKIDRRTLHLSLSRSDVYNKYFSGKLFAETQEVSFTTSFSKIKYQGASRNYRRLSSHRRSLDRFFSRDTIIVKVVSGAFCLRRRRRPRRINHFGGRRISPAR